MDHRTRFTDEETEAKVDEVTWQRLSTGFRTEYSTWTVISTARDPLPGAMPAYPG
jgi:hypothetical protein